MDRLVRGTHVTPSTAIQMGHNRLCQRSSQPHSATSGYIAISSNNYRFGVVPTSEQRRFGVAAMKRDHPAVAAHNDLSVLDDARDDRRPCYLVVALAYGCITR